MSTGKINVQTENIFPIIKKFLYSDNEIFLRELVSNAVDATQKIKALDRMGEVKGALGDLKIEVEVDKSAKPHADGRHGHLLDFGIRAVVDNSAIPLLIDRAGLGFNGVVNPQG